MRVDITRRVKCPSRGQVTLRQAAAPHTHFMARNARYLLFGALCIGVFLVGVELLVTAVALPFIVADLADWTRLREASWIINAYLVAYVAVMPLAGRAADRHSVPNLFAGSLVVFA